MNRLKVMVVAALKRGRVGSCALAISCTLGLMQLVSTIPATAATSASTAPTAGDGGTRTITDSRSGETILVTNEGECGKTTVDVHSSRSQGYSDVGVEHNLAYAVDSKCNVVITSGDTSAVKPQSSSSGSVREQRQASAAPMAATSDATAKTSTVAAAGVISGNVIHSSQTMQDVVNIDIAKYRYSHDRVWDNSAYTYFKSTAWWMASSTSVNWNHPVGDPISDGFDSDWTYSVANGYGHADFHSDFLWCNFQAGQNFRMSTNLVSYWQGGYDAHFRQNRVCSGTHMATSKSADTRLGP